MDYRCDERNGPAGQQAGRMPAQAAIAAVSPAATSAVIRAGRPARRAPALLLLGALPLLAGCVGGSPEGLGAFWKNVNADGVEGRPLPPGGEGPYPNLGRLPTKPTPPSPEARAAVDAELERARLAAGQPNQPDLPVPPPPTGTPGEGQVPVTPPVAARLPAAPPVSWAPAPLEAARPGAPANPMSPGAPPPAATVMPDAPPAPPPAEMSAPPPAPNLR